MHKICRKETKNQCESAGVRNRLYFPSSHFLYYYSMFCGICQEGSTEFVPRAAHKNERRLNLSKKVSLCDESIMGSAQTRQRDIVPLESHF